VHERAEGLRGHEQQARGHDGSLEHRKIARGVRLEDERAQPAALEHALEHHGAAEQRPQLRRHHSNGAQYLGRLDRIGTVAAGKQADLVIVRGDPGANIKDIENVEIVFKKGVGYDPAALIERTRSIIRRFIHLPTSTNEGWELGAGFPFTSA
jgi:hypothetical protein